MLSACCRRWRNGAGTCGNMRRASPGDPGQETGRQGTGRTPSARPNEYKARRRTMRTGADYRETLRSDGRQVWVLGQGRVEDVTTHPATGAMVEEYVAWYDRHRDPAWREGLIAPEVADRRAEAWAFAVPRTSDDLIGMGRSFAKTLFHSAGNVTHDPAYGHLIAMGVVTAVQERNVSAKQIADAEAYRKLIAETGRFLTFCGGAAPIGVRLRPDPAERAA